MISRIPSKGFRITEEGGAFLESKALGGFRLPQGEEEKEHANELDMLDEDLFQALSYLTFEKDSFVYSKYNRCVPPSIVFRLLRFGYIEEDEEVMRESAEKAREARRKDQELEKWDRMGMEPPENLFEETD